MKLKIDAALLREACAKALCERSTKMPILQHALLEVHHGSMAFTTTDTEKLRTEQLPVTAEAEGSATCEVARLRAALSGIEGEVTLELKGEPPAQHLALKLPGKRAYRLETLPAAEFPAWPDRNITPIDDLEPAEFLKAVGTVAYCVDPTEARTYLRGLGLSSGWVAGTDGKTGALMPLKASLPEGGIMLPKESLAALADACTGEAKFSLCTTDTGTPSGFRVKASGVTVTTRLIDQTFPMNGLMAHARTIGNYPVKLRIKTTELLAALDRLRPFCAAASGKFSTLLFKHVDGELLMSNRAEDAADQVAVTPEEGSDAPDAVTGAINPEYLRRAAGLSKDGELTLHWKSPTDFYGIGFPGRDDTHFIMQVTI